MTNYRLRTIVIFTILAILFFSAQAWSENRAEPGQAYLIDPGVPPRSELRYKLSPGQTDIVVYEGEMSIEIDMAGKKKPAVCAPIPLLTITYVVKEVSPEGDAIVETTITDVGSTTGLGTSQQAAEATQKLNDALRKLVGTVQRYTMSSEGFVTNGETDQTGISDQQIQHLVDRIRQGPAVLLPKEPVGKGARWEVTTDISDSRMKMSQTEVYTLLELNGDKIKLEAVYKQNAPVQELPSRQGAVVRLESFGSTGTSVIQVQLTKAIPSSFQMALDLSMDMSVIVTQRMKAKTGIELRMRTKTN